jgi:hypothetical protein
VETAAWSRDFIAFLRSSLNRSRSIATSCLDYRESDETTGFAWLWQSTIFPQDLEFHGKFVTAQT